MKRIVAQNILEALMKRGNAFSRPLVMGILNVTPDSFSDGGGLFQNGKVSAEMAVEKALEMIQEGADIVDIGGESSGPGSVDVELGEELERVVPVVSAIRAKSDVLISVDTYKAEVARQALQGGADMINDVTALRGDEKMPAVLVEWDCPVVVMYAKDPTARTTREVVEYDDVVATVRHFLEERIAFGMKAGIKRERFIVDPGMGAFVSEDPKYSLEILKRLQEFKKLGLPILVGASRKGFIGEVLGRMKNEELIINNDGGASRRFLGKGEVLPVKDRLEGSLACAVMAMLNGASILRVHDVQETRRVVEMVWEINN